MFDRHVRIQGIVLEDQSYPAVFRLQLRDIDVAEEDLAAGRLLQAADHVQGRTLAAAGRAEQADQFAVGDLKTEIIDGDDVIPALFPVREDLGQVLQYNFHGSLLSLLLWWLLINRE